VSIDKTKNIKRMFVPIGDLEANPNNPNEMSESEFNMLYDNIESVGFTDPILAVPHPDQKDMYRIVGGEHRWEVAKLIGYEEVPVNVIDDPSFSEDQQKFQIVRHNIIHGKMSAGKFMKLYESLSDEYTEAVASELFGFTDEAEFSKLVKATRDELPDALKKEFDKSKDDLKTIDDLTNILNHLFNTYGDTLPYGYMIFDFGGQESVWLRMGKKDLANFNTLGETCRKEGKTLDGVVSELLQLIAQDKATDPDVLAAALSNAPDVDLSSLADDKPVTLDFLDALNESE
jgi:hypothetical protein